MRERKAKNIVPWFFTSKISFCSIASNSSQYGSKSLGTICLVDRYPKQIYPPWPFKKLASFGKKAGWTTVRNCLCVRSTIIRWPTRTFLTCTLTVTGITAYQHYTDESERLEENNLQSWLISSYTTLNQIQTDNKLENRIIF